MTATTLTPVNLQASSAVAHAKGGGSVTGTSGQGFPADAADPAAESMTSSFGALFQQLMSKTRLPSTDLSLIDSSSDPIEKVGADKTADELDAMLPFLEAMGLAQSFTTEAAPITPAVTTMPAITAGNDVPQASNSSLLTTLPTADLNTPPLSTATIEPAEGIQTDSDNPNAKDISTGRDFAAQIATAIDGSKQTNQPQGSTVNVVQQVVANTSPSNTSATMTISQPVGEAGWGQEVGQRIVWMANRSEGKAELILTPPQMGRVEVSLTVSGDQATASFASANPVVREALESALPRLREVLAEAGIQLGQAQVGAENAHQSAQQEKSPDNFGSHRETSVEKSSIMASSGQDSSLSTLKVGRGLVDVFA